MRHSRGQTDDQLSDREQRELDAIDAALDGRPIPEDLADLALLTSLITDEGPVPTESLLERLDAEAAERRDHRESFETSRLGSILASVPGGSRLVDAGERFGVSANRGGDSRTGSGGSRLSGMLAPASGFAVLLVAIAIGVGVAVEDSGQGPADGSGSTEATRSGASSDTAPNVPFSAPGAALDAPAETSKPNQGGTAGALPSEEELSAADQGSGYSAESQDRNLNKRDGVLPNRQDRKQSKAASITLSTEPEKVRGVADEVIGISDRIGGVVLNSSVNIDPQSGARAQIDLELPSEALDEALAAFSDVASVEARNETVTDITAPFVSAQDSLRDARDQRRALLKALGNATSDDEAAGIQRRIDRTLNRIARAKSELAAVSRQARLSRVSVTVVGNGEFTTGDGGWGLGDAADDAVSVLRVGAGIALVSLAVLALVAIPVALAAAAWKMIARRRREGVLDDAV